MKEFNNKAYLHIPELSDKRSVGRKIYDAIFHEFNPVDRNATLKNTPLKYNEGEAFLDLNKFEFLKRYIPVDKKDEVNKLLNQLKNKEWFSKLSQGMKILLISIIIQNLIWFYFKWLRIKITYGNDHLRLNKDVEDKLKISNRVINEKYYFLEKLPDDLGIMKVRYIDNILRNDYCDIEEVNVILNPIEQELLIAGVSKAVSKALILNDLDVLMLVGRDSTNTKAQTFVNVDEDTLFDKIEEVLNLSMLTPKLTLTTRDVKTLLKYSE